MKPKRIKCDLNPEDHIEVKPYINETGSWPDSVEIRIEENDILIAVEFQSPRKVDKLIKALEKAKRKVWGDQE